MSNWWDVVKQNKLVNLPKFKVKPFNTAKPDEEDTRCKDKIIEIANFTKNFELPTEIAGEFVRVKQEGVGTDYMTMNYYGEATKAKLIIHQFARMEVDDIPEEVFCKVLDMLNNNLELDKAEVMDYKIEVAKTKDESFYGQNILIYHGGRLKVNLNLSIVWYEWFNSALFSSNSSSKRADMDDWQSMFIDEELIELSDEMEWPK